jgi:hypothetical protein
MQTIRNKGLAMGGSNVIYNTIPKYLKQLIINCVINETWGLYHLFKGEIKGWLQIKDLHGNAKENFDDLFSIKKKLFFFKKIVLGGIFLMNQHLLILNGMVVMLP